MLDNHFFGFDECENNAGRQYQISVIFVAVDKVLHAIKQIKNEMKMRFFTIGKTYQILYKNSNVMVS